MRAYNHDELHKIIEGNAILKKLSDKIHASPKTDSIEEFGEQKRKMAKIYAKAVGCKEIFTALEFADEIMAYIRQYASTLEEWRRPEVRQNCHETIVAIAKNALKNKNCCSPNGNDYVCFCGER